MTAADAASARNVLTGIEQFAHAELPERAAEIDRRQMAGAIGVEIEGGRAFAREFHFLAEHGELLGAHIVRDLAAREARRFLALAHAVIGNEAVALGIENAFQQAAHAGGPDHRRGIERELRRDLVHQIEGADAFAVDLVDEGDDRHVAQAADLEELQRLRLDALRRVDHHDGRVRRRQRAIGVFREVFMARRVEQIAGDAFDIRRSSRRRKPRCRAPARSS